MLKQFIVGILSSAVAHRLFPPPTNNGKSRGGGCILRLFAMLVVIGLLCWAVGYGLVVAPTYTLLTLYAGLKFLAANTFVALDKLFHPGFDVPPAAAWAFWGLVGGSAIQGCREMLGRGRKGMGTLAALGPILLLVFNGIIKDFNVPKPPSPKTKTTVEQNTSGSETKPIKPTQPTSTAPSQPTTEPERKPVTRTKPVLVTTTKGRPETTPNTLQKPATPKAPPGMVLIPAGNFQMGSNASVDEQPVHTVYIDEFYIDQYEVTNAQYKKFLDANPLWRKSRIPSAYHDGDYLKHWNGNNYPTRKGNHPVAYVSWYAAMAYAEWADKRLPTEAEWEKAARGGLVGKKYPWGDSINSARANYSKYVGDTAVVGRYSPNGYGLYDMAGNVFEWCLDLYAADLYQKEALFFSSSSPRQKPITGGTVVEITTNFTEVTTQRVYRGGSWSSLASAVRVADRGKADPKLSYYGVGFRCVQAIIPAMTKTTTTDTKQKTTTHKAPVQTTDTPNAAPKSDISKVWVDHNQYQDSVKGMRIHVKFNVHNFKDGNGRVVAYFYKKNGDPLKDANGRYNTTAGDVSTSGKFQPGYVNSVYNDFKLFFPYKELHIARGKHDLKFRIKIFKFNNSGAWDALSDVSDWVHFTYSR